MLLLCKLLSSSKHARVRELLGKPLTKHENLGNSLIVEQWDYGSYSTERKYSKANDENPWGPFVIV